MRAWINWPGVFFSLMLGGLTAIGGEQRALDTFKGFRGTWTIQAGEKTLPFKMTYDIGSKDSIVTEFFGKELSVFYQDGESLLMTHFCNAGNQPRLKLMQNTQAGIYAFEMFDITNLKGAQDGSHVQRAVYRVINEKRMELELVWRQGRAESSEKYVLTRD
jgi:hypothetical protein